MVGLGGTILRTTSGGVPVGVEHLPHDELPADFRLEQNYPNPFNGTTSIGFSVRVQVRVTLTVYGMLGQRVATLVDEELAPGTYRAAFEARSLASGVYFYTLTARGFRTTQRMLLLK